MCFFRKTKFVKPNLNITSKEIVVYQPFKRNKIFFGTPVKMPRNFSFVITSNGKVLDVLSDDFIISLKELPETTQYLKLYKVNKKGKGVKFFSAETYFVNKNVFEKFQWNSAEIELEDREFGAYKAKSVGDVSFRVLSPKKLIKFLLDQMGIISASQTQKVIYNFINEKISRVIEKENPTARNLYLKNNELLKTIFTNLSNLLDEIGIELMNLNLISTRFPSSIYSILSSLKEKPENVKSFGSVSFEEWQEKNPIKDKAEKKPKFVTIVPSGKKSHFFKESMAPYFFDDEDENEEENNIEINQDKKKKKDKKFIWKNIDQISKEEKEKRIVNLDDNED